MLEVEMSCILFFYDNGFSFWKESCLLLRVFKWGKHSPHSK
jgi:hypothetical protein